MRVEIYKEYTGGIGGMKYTRNIQEEPYTSIFKKIYFWEE